MQQARDENLGRGEMENNLEFRKIADQIVSRNQQMHEEGINIFVGKVLLEKLVNQVLAHSAKLAMRAVISFGKTKKRNIIQTFPSVCVMSLSKDQLFRGKTSDSLTTFFFEPRFQNPSGDILIETKSLRVFQQRYKSFQTSIPIYFYLRKLSQVQRAEVLDLFNSVVETFMEASHQKKKTNLKTLYFLFELAVWFTIKTEKITLITTQSTMRNLPVAFKISNTSFTRKMFWYSTNSQPISKKDNALQRPLFTEELNQNIDMHYVWDLNSKEFLNTEGVEKVSSVGSILFIQPELVDRRKPDFNLAYFDVTPFVKPDSYYTVERMCVNLFKLVEVLNQIKVESHPRINLLVKPKREMTGSHSQQYVQLLKNFEREGKLRIVNSETNLYGFISSVNCAIGIPFTSPVVVGRELGIPSAYMDLHNDDFYMPSSHNGFSVISDEVQLSLWLQKMLTNSFC